MKQAGTMLYSPVRQASLKQGLFRSYKGFLQKILLVNLSFKFPRKFVLKVAGN